MNVGIVDARDEAAWEAVLSRVDADAFHTAAYHRACDANGDGEPLLFFAEDGDAVLAHPILRRPITHVAGVTVDGEWYDAESAYGYVGPLASTSDRGFLAAAWDAYGEWCAATGVVAEFVRFNPLLGNVRVAPGGAELADDRQTVVVALDRHEDELWTRYPSTQRNMVRKAVANGFRAGPMDPRDDGAAFRALYAATMKRVDAAPRYAFSQSYFDALAASSLTRQLGVWSADGSLAAAALFVVRGRRMHYHLAGADRAAMPAGVMNLLLHEAIRRGAADGFDVLHLGGGRTPARDDSLLRFKRSISRDERTYTTGRLVHNDVVFGRLCDDWVTRTGARARPAYFLSYRLEHDG